MDRLEASSTSQGSLAVLWISTRQLLYIWMGQILWQWGIPVWSGLDKNVLPHASVIPQELWESWGYACVPLPWSEGLCNITLHSRGCKGTDGVGAAERGDRCGPAANHVFLEWCPGCPTLPSQPRLSQCQCWHHTNLLTTAKFLNTTVLMSACTSVSFPNLRQIMWRSPSPLISMRQHRTKFYSCSL